ncbi:unnamed protein product [Rangifer tarandus platyrhynchus]|uniref:Uncharacterized protein n=3 Tax=Rangifer tarandus platyrhynchus TaxID=3082113 RepID=A0AC59Y144_RANTA|nr:unnamed protein product [Rangifer tarandus platyrhynchus]CAI9691563.1 unnamed protein product [Rangifer tarandus platyrhynchus]
MESGGKKRFQGKPGQGKTLWTAPCPSRKQLPNPGGVPTTPEPTPGEPPTAAPPRQGPTCRAPPRRWRPFKHPHPYTVPPAQPRPERQPERDKTHGVPPASSADLVPDHPARGAFHPGSQPLAAPRPRRPGRRVSLRPSCGAGPAGAQVSAAATAASACCEGRPLARRWVRCTRGAAAVQRFMQRQRRRRRRRRPRLLLLPPRRQTDREPPPPPPPPSPGSMPPPLPPPPLWRGAGGSGPGWAPLLAAPLPTLPSARALELAGAPAAF